MIDGRTVDDCLLHVGDGLIVVDKPAGISSTGLTLADEDCVQHHLRRRFGGMIWAVHQLDKATSGVNLFVLQKHLVARCRDAMVAGEKTYVALCHGRPKFDELDIDVPIGDLDAEKRRLGVTADGKRARTHVTVLDRAERFASLRLRLFTGRTHQIRIHLGFIGHPLVGEPWYRDPPCTLAPRQALHAWRLVLRDGATPRTFVAPIPRDLVEVARSLSLRIDPE